MGGLISVMAILTKVPGGIAAVAAEGHRNNKLSLGRAEWSWEERTVPTVLTYAAVHYMTKFITFQDAVQRYLAVPSHKVPPGFETKLGGMVLALYFDAMKHPMILELALSSRISLLSTARSMSAASKLLVRLHSLLDFFFSSSAKCCLLLVLLSLAQSD